jgi:transcriptional regulator with XRE-family HTH domain
MSDQQERWTAVGEAVEAQMAVRGMSQVDLVRASGISVQTVRRISRGVPGNYRPSSLRKLSLALWDHGLVLDRILAGESYDAIRAELAPMDRELEEFEAHLRDLGPEDVARLRAEYADLRRQMGALGDRMDPQARAARAELNRKAHALDRQWDPKGHLAEPPRRPAAEVPKDLVLTFNVLDMSLRSAAEEVARTGSVHDLGELADLMHAAVVRLREIVDPEGSATPNTLMRHVGPDGPGPWISPDAVGVEVDETRLRSKTGRPVAPSLRPVRAVREDDGAEVEELPRAAYSGDDPGQVPASPEQNRPSPPPEPEGP